MAIDPSRFHRFNVADTCAVWNVISSRLLCTRAIAAGCHFSCTEFVMYECLRKPRRNQTPADDELQRRLKIERQNGRFTSYHLDIDDLLEVEILEKRRNLGKGELSSIAFAKRTRQAFHTDDQGARKLASEVIGKEMVQTTPHLFGWLFFEMLLSDSEKSEIIGEHESLDRPLRTHLEEMYERALYYRAQSGRRENSADPSQ